MDILKQLNSINVEQLKNINLNQIKDILKQRPDIFINIFLVGVTLFASIRIYTWYQSESSTINSEISLTKEKLQAVEEQKKIRSDYDKFIEGFFEMINIDEMNNKLSEMALNNKVLVISSLPLDTRSNNYFVLTGVKLDVSADDYDNILGFIKDIEDSHYAIRINRWSGRSNYDYSINNDLEKTVPLQVTLEIEAINLNNDK